MGTSEKQQSRDRLIDEYRDFVHGVAGKLIRTLHLPAELFDECVSAGYLGLVEAAERYDAASGVKFKNFAFLRVRGAIIDGIRANSPISTQAYRLMKAVQAVQLLREAETAESAGKSSGGDPAERLAKVLDFAGKAALMHRLSLHDSLKEVQGVADAGPAPDALLERKEERQALRQAIAGLSEREQLIVRRYYFEGKTLEEIAKECGGASKSWICRLHARAVEKMRQAYFGESCPNA